MGFGSSRVCKRYAVIRQSFLNFSILVPEFFSYLFFIMFGFEFFLKKISPVFACFYRMVFLFIVFFKIVLFFSVFSVFFRFFCLSVPQF